MWREGGGGSCYLMKVFYVLLKSFARYENVKSTYFMIVFDFYMQFSAK